VYFLCNYAQDDLLIKASAYKLGLNSDASNFLFSIWPVPNTAPDKAEVGAAKEELIKTHKGWTSYAASPVDTPLKTAYQANLAKRTEEYDSWCEYAYDIVYFYAAALNTLATKQQPFTGEYLKTQMLETSIVGITGRAKLEPNGDRRQAMDIFIMDTAGKQVPFYSSGAVYTGRYSTNTTVAPKSLTDTPVCDKGANGLACSGNGGCAQSFVSKKPVVLKTRCACDSGFSGSVCELKQLKLCLILPFGSEYQQVELGALQAVDDIINADSGLVGRFKMNETEFNITSAISELKVVLEVVEQTSVLGTHDSASACMNDGGHAVIGPAYSSHAKIVSQYLSRNLHKPLISFSATSPALSDGETYPYFSRTGT
jgi:ABC-type branched-subunit amino acid transport system substrate-binding protein